MITKDCNEVIKAINKKRPYINKVFQIEQIVELLV